MIAKGNRGLLESSVCPATLTSHRTALAFLLAWLQERIKEVGEESRGEFKRKESEE